ncbi:capsular polysaccharide export protein, LipB/KpsS family [Lelliottia amnigena]|jgi:capsular polysaccharide export protein
MLYILVDDIVKAGFFSCFKRNNNVIFITNKFSCFLYLKINTCNKVIFLFRPNNLKCDGDINAERLSKTISVLNKRQTLDDARKNYKAVNRALQSKLSGMINNSDLLIVFNGNHATAIATVDFFTGFRAKVLYAEISNLPNKMVFDPEGVNAQSILYRKPEVLDTLEEVSDTQHAEWINAYIAYKENPIPQSKISIPTYFMLAIDDVFTRIFKIFIKEDSLSFVDKCRMFRTKFKSRKILNFAANADLKEKYVFFPTQVTSDTQLRINSDIDNINAINVILEREEKISIYVKIHPAESNLDTISYFIELAKEKRIILVNNNTIELIKNAQRVYTINSTVGLEALIFEKDLIVLGRAIYSNFDSRRLKIYIHRYLMDFNFFGKNKLSENHFIKLSKLSEL